MASLQNCRSVWLFFFLATTPVTISSHQTEALYKRYKNTYLRNHLIRKVNVNNEMDCGLHCAREKSCLSVNYKTIDNGGNVCELNNASMKEIHQKSDLQAVVGVTFFDVLRRIPEVSQQLQTDTRNVPARSCKEVVSIGRASGNGIYQLHLNPAVQQYTSVYCHMTEIPQCGGGGWTLVMKMDGTKETFRYSSPLWTNMTTFQATQGLGGLETQVETKLATYWQTSFNKICLGMSVNSETQWLMLSFAGKSLYDLIHDGNNRKTTLGKRSWRSLIKQSSLQLNCNREGFNVQSYPATHIKVRIGFMANNEIDCSSCDSFIGFGVDITVCGGQRGSNSYTCGNVACVQADNNDKTIAAFGFIYVQ